MTTHEHAPGTYLQDAKNDYWIVLAESFSCSMQQGLVANLLTGVIRTQGFIPQPVKVITPQEIMW